jgi:phage tail tape-measure protein
VVKNEGVNTKKGVDFKVFSNLFGGQGAIRTSNGDYSVSPSKKGAAAGMAIGAAIGGKVGGPGGAVVGTVLGGVAGAVLGPED